MGYGGAEVGRVFDDPRSPTKICEGVFFDYDYTYGMKVEGWSGSVKVEMSKASDLLGEEIVAELSNQPDFRTLDGEESFYMSSEPVSVPETDEELAAFGYYALEHGKDRGIEYRIRRGFNWKRLEKGLN